MVAETTTNIKHCAICGREVNADRFCITEQWSKEDAEALRIGEERLSRADVDEDGNYTFHFCRWRHLGDFLSECGMEARARNLRDEFRSA